MDPNLLRVQAYAFNAQDVETLVSQYTGAARFVRDGQLVAEGREAVSKALVREMDGVVGRLERIGDETVLVEYEGDEGRGAARGVIRFACCGDRIAECHADHRPAELARLA